MKNNKKIILYVILLILSITIFTLALIFNASGAWGFIITMSSLYISIGCIIRLCKLSKRFKTGILAFLSLIFWLP